MELALASSRWIQTGVALLVLLGGCTRRIDTPGDSLLGVDVVVVPDNLAAIIGDRSVQLSWTVPSTDSAGVAMYLVYRSDSANGSLNRIDSVVLPPYLDPYLTNGVQYAYRVSARSTAGVEGNQSAILRALPSYFAVRINNDSAFTKSVDVRLSLSASGASLVRFASDTTLPDNWRPFGSSHSFILTSGQGPKTVFAQFQTAAGTQITEWVQDDIVLDDRAEIVSVILSDSVFAPAESLLIWADVGESGGIARYSLGSRQNVRLFDDGVPPDAVPDDSLYTAVYVTNDGDLFEQATLTVSFTDRAGNRAQALDAAWSVSVRKPPAMPTWVSLLTEAATPDIVNLTWIRVDSEPFSQLILRRSESSGGGVSAPIISIFTSRATTTYKDTDLASSTTYYYTLEVVLTNGASELSAEGVATTPFNEIPDAVIVAVQSTADSSLSLSWTKSEAPDFDSYRLFRADSASALSASPPDDSMLVGIITSSATTSYAETGLTTFYYYRVFVYDREENFSGSNTVWGPKDFGP